ncbi:MAG: hypothetical protein QOJ90_2303 [Actinomycetota bacterium]|jgi:uncharacterized Tic20 family protein|nr:hypothetical protein [Actinomycetota bacterium]
MTESPMPPPSDPGGYGAPPPPGYGYGAPPPPGYGYGGYGPAPQLSPQDERLWAMLAHLGGLVLGFLASLIVLLVQGEKSAFVRRQAVEALNFQITLLIASIVSFVLLFVLIGFILLPVVLIGGLVLMIVAGVKANAGEDYRYPVNLRLVK